VVEVGRARLLEHQLGHPLKLVDDARDVVLDGGDALKQVLLHPAARPAPLEARGRRLDQQHQARPAPAAQILAHVVRRLAALAEDFPAYVRHNSKTPGPAAATPSSRAGPGEPRP
jgi:hypothetical protein